MKPDKNPWLNFPQPNDQAKYRLFCFPYAGGGTRIFRHWPDQLSKKVEVCSIGLPGRERRMGEILITQLDCLLKTMTPYLLPYLDKPFAFFGHSMGALVSFELTPYLFKNESVTEQELQAWCQQTQKHFSLNMLRGDHFFIHSDESNLLQKINYYFL